MARQRLSPEKKAALAAQWEQTLTHEGLHDIDQQEGYGTIEDPEILEMLETLQEMNRENENKHHEFRGAPETVEDLIGLIKLLQKNEMKDADSVEVKSSTNCKSERFHAYDSVIVIATFGEERRYYHFPTKNIKDYDRMETIEKIAQQTGINYGGHRTTEMRATD